MKKFWYRIANTREKETIVFFAAAINVNIDKTWANGDDYVWATYEDNGTLSGTSEPNHCKHDSDIECRSMGQFIDYLAKAAKPTEIRIELNADYNALYTKDSNFVRVGCQVFTINKIKLLVQEIEKLNNS